MMKLKLPFPSTGKYHTLAGRLGQAFCQETKAVITAHGMQPITDRLAIFIDVYPPNTRQPFDLNYLAKVLLDALRLGGVYIDNAQISDLHIRRGKCVCGGQVHIRLSPRLNPKAITKTKEPLNKSPRICLKCGKLFDSAGSANRICLSCNLDNDQLRLSEPEIQQQRGIKRLNGKIISPGVFEEDITC